jgi:hypothetical protein
VGLVLKGWDFGPSLLFLSSTSKFKIMKLAVFTPQGFDEPIVTDPFHLRKIVRTLHSHFESEVSQHKEILQRIKAANQVDHAIRMAETFNVSSGIPGPDAIGNNLEFLDYKTASDSIDWTPTPAAQQMIDLMEESKRKAFETLGIPGLSGEPFCVTLHTEDFGTFSRREEAEVTSVPVETEEGYEYSIKLKSKKKHRALVQELQELAKTQPPNKIEDVVKKVAEEPVKHMIRRELREHKRKESLHHVMTAYAKMLGAPGTIKVEKLVDLINEDRVAFMKWFDKNYPVKRGKTIAVVGNPAILGVLSDMGGVSVVNPDSPLVIPFLSKGDLSSNIPLLNDPKTGQQMRREKRKQQRKGGKS